MLFLRSLFSWQNQNLHCSVHNFMNVVFDFFLAQNSNRECRRKSSFINQLYIELGLPISSSFLVNRHAVIRQLSEMSGSRLSVVMQSSDSHQVSGL